MSVVVVLTDGEPSVVAELEKAGVTEVVLVGAPPGDPEGARTWVAELARSWNVATSQATPR